MWVTHRLYGMGSSATLCPFAKVSRKSLPTGHRPAATSAARLATRNPRLRTPQLGRLGRDCKQRLRVVRGRAGLAGALYLNSRRNGALLIGFLLPQRIGRAPHRPTDVVPNVVTLKHLLTAAMRTSLRESRSQSLHAHSGDPALDLFGSAESIIVTCGAQR